MWRASLLALLIGVACGQPSALGSSWSADTGIYGTYDHFGNPPNGAATFLCGIGYDLRYRGRLPLDEIDVALRYPPVFLARVGDVVNTSGTDGWVRDPSMSAVVGGNLAPNPAQLGHASGTIGMICPGGASDLDSMRGAIVRIHWRDSGSDHEEQFAVDRVRGNVKVSVGGLSTDGLPKLEWER